MEHPLIENLHKHGWTEKSVSRIYCEETLNVYEPHLILLEQNLSDVEEVLCSLNLSDLDVDMEDLENEDDEEDA